MGDQVTIKDIFNQSQTGLQGHGKLIKSLTSIYKKTDLNSFTSDFFHCLKYPMVIFKREPAVERVIDFIAKFLPSLVKKETSKDKDKNLEEEEGEEEEEVDILADNKLLQETFDFLLKHHSARDRAVRFRCCQLINKLLANLGDEAQIDDTLYDRLYECMLDRLKDKCPVVRYHAVLAMARLQDPSDENCPVIKAYLFLLNCDPNADVRRSVLTSIAPSTKTLASIVGRTRDVKDTVRKTAYLVLSEKIHVKALSIAVRLQLLNEGLNDRSDIVQQACSGKLLQVWMRIFGGSILNLLKSLDVEDSTETCCIVVETLFKASSLPDIVQDFNLLEENLLIPENMLTSESVFYWQMICKYIHKMGTDGDEYLDKVLPNCVDFCGYVKQYINGLKTVEDPEIQLGREFIIEQLLLIASYMDTADSASRKALDNLLHNMVTADHVSHRLVPPFVLRICQLRGKNEGLVQYFAELVSEIREPITLVEKDIAEEQKRQLNLKIASIRVKLNQSREELDEAVRSQDFTKAAELKGVIAELDEEKARLLEASEPAREEIRTERNDPLTIQKCQTIISEMLKNIDLNAVSPTLQMMIESQILPGIQNGDADVRNMAMQALGLCCFMSRDLLVTYLPLFMQASQIDVELVRVTALQVLFDLLLIYGLDVIDATESGESSSSDDGPDAVPTDEENGSSESSAGTASKLVAIICSFLDGESSDLRTTAAEGLAKLLLSGRVVSSKILSHLILLWYNPLSEDDTHLRDCLGTFFPLFALGSRSNQELVEEAFLPTLKTLLNAPTTSPLAEVDVNNVAELLVPLTNSTLLTLNQNASETSRDNPGHDNLSEKVCNEILSDPTSLNVKLWIRILNQMEVSPDNEMVLKDLRILCFKMMKTVTEKLSLKSLSKFKDKINELASKYVTNDDDLENIEIEPPAEQQDVEVDEEEAIQTPKRRKRGLYSQNITLESDGLDMDISQDGTLDIDASCLMSRTSTMSNTPKRSRKNTATTEISLDGDDIFLKPDAPAPKEKAANNEEEDNTLALEESENDEEIEKDSKAPEKRKSQLKKTTPEKRPRFVQEKSPETGRSRSKGRKQKSPTPKSPQKEKAKRSSKSPQKETTKKSSKSPQKGTTRSSSKSPQKETAKSPSKSPSKTSDKTSQKDSSRTRARRGSKSPVKNSADIIESPSKRSSSKRKASKSPSRRESESPGKRQRSADVPSNPHLKRKASSGRRDSKSPEIKRRSQSRDKPQNKKTDTRQSKASVSKSPSKSVHQTDSNNKQANKNVRQMPARNNDRSAQTKQKVPSKESNSIQKQVDKNDEAADKSSPRKTRGLPASVVADTPESQSKISHTGKRPGMSIAETPEMDATPGSRQSARANGSPQPLDTPILLTRSSRSVRGAPSTTKNRSETPDTSTQRASVRGKGTPQAVVTPILSTRSTRSVRGTPSTEAEHTPRQGTKPTSETPDTSNQRASVRGKGTPQAVVTPILSTRSTRSVRKTPSTEADHTPRLATNKTKSILQTPEVTKDGKLVKKAVEKKKTLPSKSTDESLSSSGSSPEAKSKRQSSSQSSWRETQSQSDSSSSSSSKLARTTSGRFTRTAPTKRTDESIATTTTDDDEEEDQIRRRVRPSRKSAGSDSSKVKQPHKGKTTNIPVSLPKSSLRDSSKSKVKDTTQKSLSVAATAASRKPVTPRSQKSDSDDGGVFSSPGSARSTRSTRMTGVSQTSKARPVNKRSATVRNTSVPVQAQKSTKPQQPRWK